jgi:putative permease
MIEMVIVAGMAITIFYIIGIKYAALLGIIVGVFNIIPYIGIFTALLLSTVVTFATGTIAKPYRCRVALAYMLSTLTFYCPLWLAQRCG